MSAEAAQVLMLDSLGLLPEPAGRLRSFVSSLVLNISIGALLVWFTVTHLHHDPVPPTYVTTELLFPSKSFPPYKKPLPAHPVAELPQKIKTQAKGRAP